MRKRERACARERERGGDREVTDGVDVMLASDCAMRVHLRMRAPGLCVGVCVAERERERERER